MPARQCLGFVFHWRVCSDTLPADKQSCPCALIMNTDVASQQGSHWVCLYIDKNGHGDYFDSYGREPMQEEMIKFLNLNCIEWKSNKKRLQGYMSTVCGQNCVYFHLKRCRNMLLTSIVAIFSNKNYDLNDYTVSRYVKLRFKIEPVNQSEYVLQQICRALDIIQ